MMLGGFMRSWGTALTVALLVMAASTGPLAAQEPLGEAAEVANAPVTNTFWQMLILIGKGSERVSTASVSHSHRPIDSPLKLRTTLRQQARLSKKGRARPASQAEPTFDLVMRDTLSGVEFRWTLLNLGQEHESFNRVVNRLANQYRPKILGRYANLVNPQAYGFTRPVAGDDGRPTEKNSTAAQGLPGNSVNE